MSDDDFFCQLCSTRSNLVCPVRPRRDDAETEQGVEAWENLKDGPVEALDSAEVERVGTDDEVDMETGSCVRQARGLPEPYSPSPAERARHNLTHWPYRSWCEHCVRSRRPNSRHIFSPSSSERTVPVFVADYCYLRDSRDEDLAEVFCWPTLPEQDDNGDGHQGEGYWQR